MNLCGDNLAIPAFLLSSAPFSLGPPPGLSTGFFPGENSTGYSLGPNPLQILQDVLSGNFSDLGVPTLGQLMNDAWIMDATPGSGVNCTPGAPGCYNVPANGDVLLATPDILSWPWKALHSEACSEIAGYQAEDASIAAKDAEMAEYTVIFPPVAITMGATASVYKLTSKTEGHIYNWLCN